MKKSERHERFPGSRASEARPAPTPVPDAAALLDSIGAVIWEGDPQTLRFRFVSRAVEPLLGHPASAWTEDPDFFLSHVHPADRERVADKCRSETMLGRDHELEYRMLAADGSEVWVRDIVRVVCKDGVPISSRGILIDVSDRKRAELALRLAEERLRHLVSHAPIVLFALDGRGVVTLCEGKGLEAIDLEPSDVLGRTFTEIFPDEERIRGNLARALAGEEFCDTIEYRGRSFETRYTGLRSRDGMADGLIGVSTDVTERVRADAERRRLEDRVRQAQRLESLGVLAGGVAHDFNNLLTTILGSAEIVGHGLPEDSPQRRHVERIRSTARRAADLTKQLLTYAGRSQTRVQALDLSALIGGMRELLEFSVPRSASLRLELAESLPAVDGDAGQLSQVALNFVSNAAEALGGEPGEIRLRTGVAELDAEDLARDCVGEDAAPGRFVYLEVADTGFGMDEATRARIFDPFFSTKFAGRGLGLASVLGIVRSHRGALRVESAPGRGARFQALFPCGGAAAAPAAPVAPWKGSGTALVVDDDPDVREVAAAMLAHLGFGVRSAPDAPAALELLRVGAEEFDLVLLDVTMPEMSGHHALERLRSLRPNVPVVLMSGYNEQYARERLLEGSKAVYLQKPFDEVQLAAAIHEAYAAS